MDLEFKKQIIGGRVLLVAETTDPKTGVTIIDELDPRMSIYTKTEEIPGTGLRRISQEEQDKEIIISILSSQGLVNRYLNYSHDLQTDDSSLRFGFMHNDWPISFVALYEESNLSQIQVIYDAFDYDAYHRQVNSSPLKENLARLHNLFILRGEVKTFYPDVNVFDPDDLTPKQADSIEDDCTVDQEEISWIMQSWSEPDKNQVRYLVEQQINRILADSLPQLALADKQIFLYYLNNKVLTRLPADFNRRDKLQQGVEVNKLFRRYLVDLICDNEMAISNKSNFTMEFNFLDDEWMHLIIMDQEDKEISNNRLGYSEKGIYDNFHYLLDRSRRRVFTHVYEKFPSQRYFKFSAPVMLNLTHLVGVMTVPESKGWEKALNMVA